MPPTYCSNGFSSHPFYSSITKWAWWLTSVALVLGRLRQEITRFGSLLLITLLEPLQALPQVVPCFLPEVGGDRLLLHCLKNYKSLNEKILPAVMWWCTPTIPEPWRLREKECSGQPDYRGRFYIKKCKEGEVGRQGERSLT